MITSEDLSSVFGKVEMEVAAAKIVNRVMETGTWDTEFWPSEFRDDYDELVGLVFLAMYGWVKDGCSGNSFVVDHEFAEKVIERLADETMKKYVAEHVRVNQDWADD